MHKMYIEFGIVYVLCTLVWLGLVWFGAILIIALVCWENLFPQLKLALSRCNLCSTFEGIFHNIQQKWNAMQMHTFLVPLQRKVFRKFAKNNHSFIPSKSISNSQSLCHLVQSHKT